MPKEKTADLYKAYTIHEKKFGEKVGIESVIMKKRRLQYEEEIGKKVFYYYFNLQICLSVRASVREAHFAKAIMCAWNT